MTATEKDGSATAELTLRFANDERWQGISRPYTADDVVALRGRFQVEHTLARLGAERLWELLQHGDPIGALGAVTGGQAVQMVRAGLQAIYLSGWQVAAEANLAGQTYPDQSLYPANSVPALVRRLNNALLRADQIDAAEGHDERYWLAPIVADAEAGFGGPLNAYELMKAMIEAGAAGVHFEDQLAAEKKCGHLGGKVLVPTSQFVRTLVAARLAADVLDVPTVLVARTDALSASLLTSDIDAADAPFVTGERTAEGFFRVRDGIDAAIARSLAYAPYADMLWFETSTPDLGEAREFAAALHEQFPGKLLAYNCSPSFNWKRHLDETEIARFRETLDELGYRFQFITLAGFHSLNAAMFELARDYAAGGMPAYVELQEREFELEEAGYTATRHQREVGAGYFDRVAEIVSGGRVLDPGAARVDGGRAVRIRSSVRLEVLAAGDGEILSPGALGLIAHLHEELNPTRLELLAKRHERQLSLAAGARPSFLTSNGAGPDWKVAAAPADLRDRRLRDHRAAGPQDDDQRAQLRRARLHVRLRGRLLADLVERGGGAAEPPRCGAPHDLARDARPALCPERGHCDPRRPAAGLAPRRAARRRGGDARVGLAVRLRARVLPQRAGATRARERAVLLPPEAREQRGGSALGPRLPDRGGRARDPVGLDPVHRADRDDPGGIRDGRDPRGSSASTAAP